MLQTYWSPYKAQIWAKLKVYILLHHLFKLSRQLDSEKCVTANLAILCNCIYWKMNWDRTITALTNCRLHNQSLHSWLKQILTFSLRHIHTNSAAYPGAFYWVSSNWNKNLAHSRQFNFRLKNTWKSISMSSKCHHSMVFILYHHI